MEFNQDGDVSARYDIMNYQIKPDGTFDYVQIGEWNSHKLNFFEPLQSPPSGTVKSVCSEKCAPGFYKVNDNMEIKLLFLMKLFSDSGYT